MAACIEESCGNSTPYAGRFRRNLLKARMDNVSMPSENESNVRSPRPSGAREAVRHYRSGESQARASHHDWEEVGGGVLPPGLPSP